MKTYAIKHSTIVLSMALVALSSPSVLLAQDHSGHDMSSMSHSHAERPGQEKKPAKPVSAKKAKKPDAPHPNGKSSSDTSAMDAHLHAKSDDSMNHMDHGSMQGMDHGAMEGLNPNEMRTPQLAPSDTNGTSSLDQSEHQHTLPPATGETAAGHDMSKPQQSQDGMTMGPMQGGSAPPDARDPNAYADGFEPSTTSGMSMADDALFGRVMINELEATHRSAHSGQRLNAEAWYGGDYNKVWFKMEGERSGGTLEGLRSEVLWDRVFATFWSTQLGIRHDTGGGPSRDWAAFGIRGLAPYWFETEATAYVGSGGRLAARAEARYELLFTQRLILEPRIEANFYGQNDAARGIGSGLSDLGLDLRLRYEIRRQFAPYIGVTWKRKFGNTADFARQEGNDIKETQVVAGVRIWF